MKSKHVSWCIRSKTNQQVAVQKVSVWFCLFKCKTFYFSVSGFFILYLQRIIKKEIIVFSKTMFSSFCLDASFQFNFNIKIDCFFYNKTGYAERSILFFVQLCRVLFGSRLN